MATLDLTVARAMDTAGIRQRRVVGYTGPASYATGGDAIAAGDIKLGVIEHIPTFVISNGTTSFICQYSPATGKIIIYTAAAVPGPAVALAEVTAATALNTFTGRFEATGK